MPEPAKFRVRDDTWGRVHLQFRTTDRAMRAMKYFLLIWFLVTVHAFGLWALIDPDGHVAFRRRRRWPEGLFSGGYFYATAKRARISGGLLAITTLALLYLLYSASTG